jgi:hypothetical protein
MQCNPMQFLQFIKKKKKNLKFDSRYGGQSYKYFTVVTYNHNKENCSGQCMQGFLNKAAFFTVVIYKCRLKLQV